MEYFILIKWIHIKIFNTPVILRLIKKSYMFWEKPACLKTRSYLINYSWNFLNLKYLEDIFTTSKIIDMNA